MSVSSIKRAEAGKQVLYRTLSIFARFFQVSIDFLLPNSPLPAWLYNHLVSLSIEPCLGRDWELHQLHSLLNYVQSERSSKTIYVHGMTGSGKTHLLEHFIHSTRAAGKKDVYFTRQWSESPQKQVFSIANLIKALLQVPDRASTSDIKEKAHLVASSSLSYFCILKLLGSQLSHEQIACLQKQSSSESNQMYRTVVTDLIRYAVHKQVAIVVIDDTHHLSVEALQFLRFFIDIPYAYPILFVVIAQHKDRFTTTPDWLSLAHNMPLQALDPATLHSLAKHYLLKKGVTVAKYQAKVALAIKRSAGNPEFLQQLLSSADPNANTPEKLQFYIDKTLSNMPPELSELFQFSALQGFHFNVSQLSQFTRQKHVNAPLCLAQKMLCSGLVIRRSDHYSFSHPLIWEGVKNYRCKMAAN